MILNKDVHFEERMMCILNIGIHHHRVIVLGLGLIDRRHFLALGICLWGAKLESKMIGAFSFVTPSEFKVSHLGQNEGNWALLGPFI